MEEKVLERKEKKLELKCMLTSFEKIEKGEEMSELIVRERLIEPHERQMSIIDEGEDSGAEEGDQEELPGPELYVSDQNADDEKTLPEDAKEETSTT